MDEKMCDNRRNFNANIAQDMTMRFAHYSAMIATSDEFRAALKRTGAKIADVARATGIAQNKLSKVKSGVRNIPATEASAITSYFDALRMDPSDERETSRSNDHDAAPLDAASATVRADAERVGIEFDLGNAGTFRVMLSAEKAAILGIDLEEATKRSRRLSFDSPSTTS